MEIKVYNLYKDSSNIFPIEKADYKREWMDQYDHSFAYRCLPLKIANECGWLVKCPVDFDSEYISDTDFRNSVKINIYEKNSIYKNYIQSHFGRGVITFSLPYIFRTEEPWCVWVRGYPNYFKDNVSFLEGIVETYWLHSTFTYNIRLIEKNKIVSFKKGEPLFFITCINIQQINNSSIVYDLIDNNLELKNSYNNWNMSRLNFNNSSRGPNDWQKDYFKGIKQDNTLDDNHLTKIKTNIKNE